MGRVVPDDEILRVQTISLDDVCGSFRVPEPQVVKMDIEGGETEALAGASRLLAQKRATWFVALHGREAKMVCETILREAGYELFALDDSPIKQPLVEWPGDEIYAKPAEHAARTARATPATLASVL